MLIYGEYLMSAQRQRKRPEKKPEEKVEVSRELIHRTTIELEDYIKRLKTEVEKGQVKYYTPFTLAQAYDIKVSDAKKVLREGVRLGILKVYSGGRRSVIFVPLQTK